MADAIVISPLVAPLPPPAGAIGTAGPMWLLLPLAVVLALGVALLVRRLTRRRARPVLHVVTRPARARARRAA